MMQPIYLQRRPHPLNQFIPFLTQMAMMKIGANIRAKEAEIEHMRSEERMAKAGVISRQIKKVPAGDIGQKVGTRPADITLAGKGYRVTPPKPQQIKKGTLFTVQTPKGPMHYEYIAPGVFRPTGLKVPSKTTGTKPTVTDLKLETWKSYLKGDELTLQQKQLIGVDVDAYLARAAQMVAGDPTKLVMPIEQKIQHIINMADLMRQSAHKGIVLDDLDPLNIRDQMPKPKSDVGM